MPPKPSAQRIIEAALANLGLRSLARWAWTQHKRGVPIEQIFLEMRERPEYQARFPGIDVLRKKGRAISESQWIEYERSAAQMFRAAGLPSGFYDRPNDFSKFITGEVSLAELQDRVQTYTQAAFAQPPELRNQLRRLYGVNEGDLAAFFMDPNRALPLIQQRFVAAQVSGRAATAGFGQLTASEAEGLAQEGVTDEEAAEAFGEVVNAAELFQPIEGGEDTLGRSDQLSLVAGNTQARQRVEKQAARRKARFGQGGGFAGSQTGISGLGSART